jgi:hypothetical protein
MNKFVSAVSILGNEKTILNSHGLRMALGNIPQMPATPSQNRKAPLLGRRLWKCSGVGFHPAANEFRKRPITLLSDSLEAMKQGLWQMNLRSHNDINL